MDIDSQPSEPVRDQGRSRAIPTFLVGTAVGGLAGATAGILLGFNMRALAAALSRTIGRNQGGDEPRFEYLSQ